MTPAVQVRPAGPDAEPMALPNDPTASGPEPARFRGSGYQVVLEQFQATPLLAEGKVNIMTLMKPLSATVFQFDPSANVTLEFDPAETGRPRGLKYRIGQNGVLDAPRLELAPFDRAAVRLEDYAGRYRCVDLAAEYDLLLDGDRLIARHQRLSDIPIEPYQTDLFHSLQTSFGRLAFRRKGGGRIYGFTMSAAVAEGLWFERVA